MLLSCSRNPLSYVFASFCSVPSYNVGSQLLMCSACFPQHGQPLLVFGFRGAVWVRNVLSSWVDFLLLIGVNLFRMTCAAAVHEPSPIISYGVFGALPCVALAADVDNLAMII